MTSDDKARDARIDELEVRLAHQDQAVHELGDEVYRQQRQIAQLESLIRLLTARLERAEGEPSDRVPADEIPPHY